MTFREHMDLDQLGYCLNSQMLRLWRGRNKRTFELTEKFHWRCCFLHTNFLFSYRDLYSRSKDQAKIMFTVHSMIRKMAH